MTVQSFQKKAYSEQHVGLLQSLAAYTAIALDNAGAYGLVKARETELATINRIVSRLAEKLDLNSVIQLVGDQTRELFRAPIAHVALLDRATMMVIQSRHPILMNHDVAGNTARMGVERLGRAAAAYRGVPIPAAGVIIGVISVQSMDEDNRFTEADQRLLATVASAVGVAIHNARLFEEARQARAAAEEADTAKSSFLSTVSHELRTPLTSVLGFAKIIRRRLEERLLPLIPDGDRKLEQAKRQVVENVDVVVAEGSRLTKLIDDVLDLAKIEAGKFTWNMESVAVPELIERAVMSTSSLFDGKQVQLVHEVAGNLP